MKRLLAVLAVLCCLLLLLPSAFAEPAEEEPAAEETELPEEEGEALPETLPEEEESEPSLVVDYLAGETAIRSIQITAVVEEDGHVSVTQQLEVSIVGAPTELRFAVPENSRNREIAGWRVRTSTENGARFLTVKNKAGFTGQQQFTISYTQDEIVSAGEESQKLTLPLVVPQAYRIGSVSLAVNLPKAFESRPGFTSGYYNEIVEDYMTYGVEGTAVVGTVNDILQDADHLTMTLTLPEGYFSGRFGGGALGGVMMVLTILCLLAAALLWWRSLRNPPLRTQARTLPPDGVNPGDLPFLIAGGNADFNMLVSHWATLGYLTFYINRGGHVILRRRMEMGNERRPFERKLFDLLFGKSNLCDGASTRYKKVGERAMKIIPAYWNRRLYDKRSGSPVLARGLCCLATAFAMVLTMDGVAPEKLHGMFLFLGFVAGFALCAMVIGAVGGYLLSDWLRLGIGAACGLLMVILGGLSGTAVLMLACVGCGLFIGWQTAHGGRRTPYGTEVIVQTMGFRRFLLHADEQQLQQLLRRDPQYFYKILPYAQAMGQGRRFVSMFHNSRPEPCPWFENASGTPASLGEFYDQYLESLDMLNISIHR